MRHDALALCAPDSASSNGRRRRAGRPWRRTPRPGERVELARQLLARVRDQGRTAYVDGFSDVSELPSDAAEALVAISERAPLRRRVLRPPERTFMAVRLDVLDPEDFDLLLAFAPYSIHAELVGDEDSVVLVLHDMSTAIEVRANSDVVNEIVRGLPSGLTLEPNSAQSGRAGNPRDVTLLTGSTDELSLLASVELLSHPLAMEARLAPSGNQSELQSGGGLSVRVR